MYALLFSLVLRRLPAETVHRASMAALRLIAAVPGPARLLRRLLAPEDPALTVRALGLEFPGPLGLAAGFVFGFVEIGTVTAEPQPGNPLPRLFRLPADRAIVNRMGFNSQGSARVARRLRRLRRRNGPAGRGRRVIIGVNIGKTKTVPE